MKTIKLAFEEAIAYQIWSEYEKMVANYVEDLLPLGRGTNRDFFW